MNTLHLVFTLEGLVSCQKLKTAGDNIVLMGDSTYSIHNHPEVEGLFALADDSNCRGIQPPTKVVLISYEELVDLCVNYSPVVSWNE